MTQAWRAHLALLAVALLALIALFWRDAADMAGIWWNSSTFAHCLFVIPIAGWLIWQRWKEVARLTPRSWPPGLALVALGGLSWLLGEAGGIALLRHAGLIFMIQATVPTLLGPQVLRGLLFPIFYLVFLVPFGEEFVPPLQTLTAKLSMAMLGWVGIPAHIEGVFIQTPSGLFEVAEACSGVKFLVAMVAYGALVANVCFRSWLRRIAFMAACVIVPILANGVRAYGIMHIAYATSSDFAASVDHVIWGWMFFAAIMVLTLAIGWRFFDRRIEDPWLGAWAVNDAGIVTKPNIYLAAALIGLAAIPIFWQGAVARTGRIPVANAIVLPSVPGWTPAPLIEAVPWQPQFKGADHRLLGAYRDANGRRVIVAIGLYGWQTEGKEAVGYGQGPVPPESDWSWTNDTAAPRGGKAERVFAPGVQREVASFYVVDGLTSGSASAIKLRTLRSRLFGGDQAAVAIMVAADEIGGRPARPVIDAFLAAMGPPEMVAKALIAQARGG
jgi:exosortase A